MSTGVGLGGCMSGLGTRLSCGSRGPQSPKGLPLHLHNRFSQPTGRPATQLIAALNRATFYLHYPDKNALLQAMTGVRFRDLIERRGITFTNCNGALRAIALGVCDYLAESPGCPSQLARIPLDGSTRPVVEDMFKEGLALQG